MSYFRIQSLTFSGSRCDLDLCHFAKNLFYFHFYFYFWAEQCNACFTMCSNPASFLFIACLCCTVPVTMPDRMRKKPSVGQWHVAMWWDWRQQDQTVNTSVEGRGGWNCLTGDLEEEHRFMGLGMDVGWRDQEVIWGVREKGGRMQYAGWDEGRLAVSCLNRPTRSKKKREVWFSLKGIQASLTPLKCMASN